MDAAKLEGMDLKALDELIAKATEVRAAKAEKRKNELLKELEELGVAPAPTNAGAQRQRAAAKPKYRDPDTGETWSGKGRAAKWMQTRLDAGAKKEDFLIPEDER